MSNNTLAFYSDLAYVESHFLIQVLFENMLSILKLLLISLVLRKIEKGKSFIRRLIGYT